MNKHTSPVKKIVHCKNLNKEVHDFHMDLNREIYEIPYILSLKGRIIRGKKKINKIALLFGSKEVAQAEFGLRCPDIKNVLGRKLSKPASLIISIKVFSRKAANRLGIKFIKESSLFKYITHSKYYDSGFSIKCNLLGYPCSCNFSLVAYTTTGGQIDLCKIYINRSKLKVSFRKNSPKFQPLMVTSVGRSGSTWLMHLLLQHPNILIIPKYTYEVVLARKVFEKALGMVLFQDYGRSQLETFLSDNLPSINTAEIKRLVKSSSHRSISQLVNIEVNTTFENAMKEVELFYDYISRDHNNKKIITDKIDGPIYFAEKNLGPEELFWEIYSGAKEIFLVRDFRDMICSSLAFGKRKGFGRTQVRTDREYCYHRASIARPWILEPYKRRSSSAHLVRYEELILSPQKSLKDIFNYLELESNEEVIENMLKEARESSKSFQSHISAKSVNSSIGRWKSDMSKSLQKATIEAFGEFFETFGYEV